MFVDKPNGIASFVNPPFLWQLKDKTYNIQLSSLAFEPLSIGFLSTALSYFACKLHDTICISCKENYDYTQAPPTDQRIKFRFQISHFWFRETLIIK